MVLYPICYLTDIVKYNRHNLILLTIIIDTYKYAKAVYTEI